MKEKKEERKFERPTVKKNTFQLNNDRFNLRKSFDKTKNPKALRYHSTKLVVNFVPQIKPKKSFLKPTFFQLNKDDKDENEKSFELDKISSCDEMDDDDESNDSSSIMSSSSSDSENIKEEDNNNEKENEPEFTLDDNKKEEKKENLELNLNIDDDSNLSDSKGKKKSSVDEYENLAYKKKQSININETEENKNDMKHLRKEMTKIRSKTIMVKSKETEEIINQNMKNNFHLGKNNFLLDFDDEKENNIENISNKKPTLFEGQKFISNKNISILDILSFKNKKN